MKGTNQFKTLTVMSAKTARSDFSLKMVPCQFGLTPWLFKTRFLAIFVAAMGATIATTPASAFSLKTDSVNTLSDNHLTSSNSKLKLNQIKLIDNQATDELNLDLVRGYSFKEQISTDKDTTANSVSQLLQKTDSNIQTIIQASEVSQRTIDGTTFYKYYLGNAKSITKDANLYTNIWKAPASPPKRKIPEPSTIIGLIAIACLFRTQRQLIKRS